MLEDGFIPVLLAAAGDEDQDGGLAGISLREHQRALQMRISIVEGHFLRRIRERPLRGLRTVQLVFSGSKGQRQGLAHLRKGADNLIPQPKSFVAGAEHRNPDDDLPHIVPFDLDRDTLCGLIRRVHTGLITVQVEDDCKFHSLDIEFSRPCAVLGVRKERE